ncbi:MAG: PDZ domain-containing protein [Labilithrix sp.]|nr:PDZ domain-containing protein [Labilithrix sp.]MCW5810283.1 PDZ domain-containing protein [Labilithrix sp.]
MISRDAVFALAKALEGIPVLGALEGSPAARAGVRYGDVLLTVNGERVRSVVDYVAARGARSDGMQVTVFRGGTTLELSFEYEAPSEPVDLAHLTDTLARLRLLP